MIQILLEKNDIDIILPLDKEFHGKENTNSNIINDIESQMISFLASIFYFYFTIYINIIF